MQNYVRLDKQGTPTDRPTDHRTFALLDLTAPKVAAGKNVFLDLALGNQNWIHSLQFASVSPTHSWKWGTNSQ